MPNINTPSSGHVGPSANMHRQWLPYTAADSSDLAMLNVAMNIINTRIKGHSPCNAAFQALPGGRTFADIWNDSSVWISYNPVWRHGYFGSTSGKDITIAKYAFSMGHWTIAATLVHELAHVNGAPGHNTQAEDTLKACLLRDLYDPSVIGSLTGPFNDPHMA
ncbi:MAG: hypothetical protein LBI92_04340 [Azoarcus sp.]|jgi:hypothetical protein|nr:hypothetical protein [Azoarcus sp.]